MAATPPQTLITQANCFACYGASVNELLKLSLWDKISQVIPVASFLERSGITDPATIAALNTLVLSGRANGWWDKCDVVYPFVGATAQAHAQNLKSSNFTITWNGAVTHDANGATGNGTTGYGDTGYIPSSSGQMLLNSAHVGIYRRNFGNNTRRAFGVVDAGNAIALQQLDPNTARIIVNDAALANAVGVSLGWIVANRISSTQKNVYSGSTDFPLASVSTVIPARAIFVLANNNAGAASQFSTVNLAGFTAGRGLAFAEYQLMAADWQAFNTAMGRQV